MCDCKKPEDKRVPDIADFHEHFQNAFRALCVDYAFLEEFLSRENLRGMINPSSAHQAANDVFWTYRDSLYLGVARLADGSNDALSLQNFRCHHQKLPRWTEPDYKSEFRRWLKAFNAWMESKDKATILIYRDENLGHSLSKGAAEKRTRGAYKGFEGNSVGRYMSKEGEVLKSCREGIRLLWWLTRLNAKTVDCFSFEEAAEKDLQKEIEKCRHVHAALLDLI